MAAPVKKEVKQNSNKGTTPAIMGEMARSILPSEIWMLGEYRNPETLIKEKGYKVFEEMRRDDLISPLIKLKKMLVLAFDFRIAPAVAGDKECMKRAAFTEWALNDGIDRSFFRSMNQMLEAEWYGFSMNEIIYKYIEEGEYKGKVGISTVKGKPQKTFRFAPDKFGNLGKRGSVWQEPEYGQKIKIKYEKFIHHLYEPHNENPFGRSHLVDVYRAWWCKDIVHHFYAKHLEKWGSPVVEAKIPSHLGKGEKQRLAQILNSFQHGTSFYHRSDIEFIVWRIMPPSHYENAIALFNTAISRGLGVPDLIGFTNMGAGSYALGKEQASLFYGLIGVDRDNLLETLNYQLIPRIEDINFPKTGRYSYMEVSRVKIKDFSTALQVFTTAFNAGGFNPAYRDDLNRFRSAIGLDELSEEEHKSYLNTWNDIRKMSGGTNLMGQSKPLETSDGYDGEGEPLEKQAAMLGKLATIQAKFAPKPMLAGPTNGGSMKKTKPTKTENKSGKKNYSAEEVDKIISEYQSGNINPDVNRDFAGLQNQMVQTIWGEMGKWSDDAMREVVAFWDESDVETVSKEMEANGRGDIATKLRNGFKSAEKRGLIKMAQEFRALSQEEDA